MASGADASGASFLHSALEMNFRTSDATLWMHVKINNGDKIENILEFSEPRLGCRCNSNACIWTDPNGDPEEKPNSKRMANDRNGQRCSCTAGPFEERQNVDLRWCGRHALRAISVR